MRQMINHHEIQKLLTASLAAAVLIAAGCSRSADDRQAQNAANQDAATALANRAPANVPSVDSAISPEDQTAMVNPPETTNIGRSTSTNTTSETGQKANIATPSDKVSSSQQRTRRTTHQATHKTTAHKMHRRQVARHTHSSRLHHNRQQSSVNWNRRAQKNRQPASQANTSANTSANRSGSVVDDTTREQFKRDMSNRVNSLRNELAQFHNPSPITDTETRYSERVEKIRLAEDRINHRLESIDTVPSEHWGEFKRSFRSEVSTLENNFEELRQARR